MVVSLVLCPAGQTAVQNRAAKSGEVTSMLRKPALLCLGAMAIAAAAFAQEGPVPKGVPKLDHVFVILMENHGYGQVIGNPNSPFVNTLAESANSSHNYFAIAHPSLTHYLAIVSG